MTDFWDKRYSETEYAYGIQPNTYIKQNIDKLPLGSILFPAEGEGRNAIYAAKAGWQVTAFDNSEVGKTKALKLAQQEGVTIDYKISKAENYIPQQHFDVLALSYAHFPIANRSKIHNQLMSCLKPGATIIFEAFSKDQLKYDSGGPKDERILFSLEEIKQEFPNVNFKELKKEIITLNEGPYHQGLASIIRFTGELMESQ